MLEITILSAEAKREEDKAIKMVRNFEKEIKKCQEIQVKTELKEKWLKELFANINKAMSKATDCLSYYIIDFDNYSTSSQLEDWELVNIMRECCDIIIESYELAGYQVDLHEYSKSWRTRSNRFGYFNIDWRIIEEI